MPSLTPKQIKFAHYVAEGLTATEAYRRAYSTNGTTNTVKVSAHEVRHLPAVKAYIDTLKAETAALSRLSREEILNRLDRMIVDPDLSANARVAAIKARNEMTGDNAPQKVDVFGLGELLELVRKQ